MLWYVRAFAAMRFAGHVNVCILTCFPEHWSVLAGCQSLIQVAQIKSYSEHGVGAGCETQTLIFGRASWNWSQKLSSVSRSAAFCGAWFPWYHCFRNSVNDASRIECDWSLYHKSCGWQSGFEEYLKYLMLRLLLLSCWFSCCRCWHPRKGDEGLGEFYIPCEA